MFRPIGDLLERLGRGEPYPTSPDDIREGGWGTPAIPAGAPPRVAVPEHSILVDFTFCGGGYGDPVDRPPAAVVRDIRQGVLTRATAERIHGVVQDVTTEEQPDEQATAERRRAIRAERTAGALVPEAAGLDPDRPWQPVLRFHEYLDLVRDGANFAVRCRTCGRLLCSGDQNYKDHAAQRTLDLEAFSGKRLPNGAPYQAVNQEYACPGCGTLLAVDVLCPTVTDSAPLWDIRIDTSRLGTVPG
jgi:N-methylhydantoinase B